MWLPKTGKGRVIKSPKVFHKRLSWWFVLTAVVYGLAAILYLADEKYGLGFTNIGLFGAFLYLSRLYGKMYTDENH
ncbi:hypothetical protein D3C87_1587410 [compost metagenome]